MEASFKWAMGGGMWGWRRGTHVIHPHCFERFYVVLVMASKFEKINWVTIKNCIFKLSV